LITESGRTRFDSGSRIDGLPDPALGE
jgi:hypothetical protein